MSIFLPVRRLLPLFVLGLVLTGCASEPTTDDAPTAAETTTDEAAAGDESDGASADGGSLIAAAVDESAGFTSARTRFTSVVTTPEGDIDVRGEGVSGPDRAAITMTMSGQSAAAFGAGEIELEIRLLDGVMYQRNPALLEQFGVDAEWISFDADSLGPEFANMLEQAKQADPSESLAVLREVADVTEVGRETVNEVETTHYSGQLDVGAALESSGMDPATMAGSGIDVDQPVPVDVWIDDDGLVRRYEMSMDVQGMASTTSFEVLEYGVELDVTAPPAEATVSFEELVGQGQGG